MYVSGTPQWLFKIPGMGKFWGKSILISVISRLEILILVRTSWLCESFFSLDVYLFQVKADSTLFYRSGDNTGEVTIFNNVVI